MRLDARDDFGLTADQQIILADFGNTIIHDCAVIIVESMVYAVYIITFFSLLRILRRKGFRSRAKAALLLAALLMFLFSSALWALDVAALTLRTRAVLVVNLDTPLEDRLDNGSNIIFTFNWIQDILYSFEFVLGDCIVVWRACALARGNRRLLIVLSLLLLGSAVASLTFFGCIIHYDFPFESVALCTNAEVAALSLSIATNIGATGSIGYIAWHHSLLVRAAHGDSKYRRSRLEKILWSLVESGMIYVVLWVSQIFYFLPIEFPSGSPASFIQIFLSSIGQQIAGLYPTLIILIVHLGLSQLDSVPATQNNTMVHTTLQFATRPGDNQISRSQGGTSTRYSSGMDGQELELGPVGVDSQTSGVPSHVKSIGIVRVNAGD